MDKLTNYIRYWQAAGESERISERTRTRIRQLTSEGFFTGGVCPFGYQLVRQGRENKRKQPLYDLMILPVEAETVRVMFSKVAYEGCGTSILANYLNERKLFPKSGRPWNPASLSGILQNRLYVGELHKGDAVSHQEHLRIIDDGLFQEVQEIIRVKKQTALSHRTTPTWGRALLSGFLYCGACGSRLSSTHIVRHYQRKDGSVTTTRTQKYICRQRRNGVPCDCSGQHTYLAEKLDQKVITEITSHLSKIWNKDPHALAEEKVLGRMSSIEAGINDARNRKQAMEQKLNIIQAEAFACMEGKASFPAEQIQLMYASCHEQLIETTNQLASLTAKQADLEHEIWEGETMIKAAQERWKEFATAPLERRKYILSYFLSRVVVKPGYQIEIQFL